MKVLNKKLSKNGGFTLVELLIVVAIIAILVAISIPLLMESLEKSRHGVDDANYRDAISLANVKYLTNINDFSDGATHVFAYIVDETTHQGVLSDEITTFDGSNSVNAVEAECTETQNGASGDRPSGQYSFVGSYLLVKIAAPASNDPNGTPRIVAGWVSDNNQFNAFRNNSGWYAYAAAATT